MADYPELPTGLEYEPIVRASEVCPNCYGAVALGGRMIRLDKARPMSAFKTYFPASAGICLRCAQARLGEVVAVNYGRTEEAIDVLDKIREAAKDDDPRKAATVATVTSMVDHLNNFVDLLSRTISGLKKIEIEYVTPPSADLHRESRDVRNEADAGKETEQA